MKDHIDLENLITITCPGKKHSTKKKSRSPCTKPNNCSAFGTSCRKVSKFDVVDPLNCSLITPGPGSYKPPPQFSKQTKAQTSNYNSFQEQYNIQKFFEDKSSKIIFKRPKNTHTENLNITHQSKPSLTFSKLSADRKLWEPKNHHHPYKMPESSNPGPGFYEKIYVPVHQELSSCAFKSGSAKFENIAPSSIGPGSYSQDYPKKFANCENFGSKAQRVTKIKLDDSVNNNPAPGDYTPYVSKNTHSSSYVFNSMTKRYCQVMPVVSVGVGDYDLDRREAHPVSFPQTERSKFDYFKGQPGVGPAYYVNTGKGNSRAASFDYYTDRFYPTDKSGIYLIQELGDNKEMGVKEHKVRKKKNNKPFNSGEDRFIIARDNWIKKDPVPDPGCYNIVEDKKLGFGYCNTPRFKENKNNTSR